MDDLICECLHNTGATGHTIPTVNNTTSNNRFNIFAIAGAVVLLVVAMMIIVIVMISALRCHHSALDLQKNNRLDYLSVLRLRLLFSVVFFCLLDLNLSQLSSSAV